ncbi:RHS repeat-associated core domain-containing protein [Chryseobacterium tructae]|nr:RHS repeat-associated core domain-containing protein [Chryseobacterium tructae]MDN3693297.1 RHS repeat-associated core domain-containing protein [Chryseobacterium tructae]
MYEVTYQYKYNGKELQKTSMYDYGARMYMPDLGRWGVVDPLAETSRQKNKKKK